jgi:hypothetical protein
MGSELTNLMDVVYGRNFTDVGASFILTPHDYLIETISKISPERNL